jgi:L-iditol 2-dehydrogenase
MQAIRLYGTGDLRLDRVAIPDPAAGEVLIRVEAAGICGTDRHLFKGEFPCTPPVTLGHEFSGIVTASGAGVDLALGTRVTCDPNTWCGRCGPCRQGRVNLCQNNVATGLSRDGGFAEWCVFPSHKAHALPADLPPLHGAFCEPLACTLHGMDRAALTPGERCIVLGGGVIGLLALQLARAAGCKTLLITRNPAKQSLGLALGATHVASTPEAALKIWPDGASAVIECAGVTDTVESAPSLTARGGRIVILGVLPKGALVRLEPFDLLFREIQLLHSFINPFTQERAARMIASGQIHVAPLITRICDFDEARATIASPAPPGEVRAILVPQ